MSRSAPASVSAPASGAASPGPEIGHTATVPLRGRRGAVGLITATLVTAIASATTPTPLYRLYQDAWGFSPVVLTVVFGAYALALLVALLAVGTLSDRVGRRPVILVALALLAVSAVLFWLAGSTLVLLVARIVQGAATGIGVGALGAALLDLDPQHGPMINSLGGPLGMGVGALGAGLLVDFAPWPLQLVYVVLLAAFAVEIVLVARMAETHPAPQRLRLHELIAGLRPRVAVPPQARGPLLAVTPVNVAIWALGGFYLSLMPSLLRDATGTQAAVVGGVAVAALTMSGAVGIVMLRARPAAAIVTAGSVTLLVGLALVLAGVHMHALWLLLAGSMVAGFGWGGTYLGVMRTLLPLAAPAERGGLMSAYFVESYLAMSVPAILAGAAVRSAGLVATTDVYAGVLVLLIGTTLAVELAPLIRRGRR